MILDPPSSCTVSEQALYVGGTQDESMSATVRDEGSVIAW